MHEVKILGFGALVLMIVLGTLMIFRHEMLIVVSVGLVAAATLIALVPAED